MLLKKRRTDDNIQAPPGPSPHEQALRVEMNGPLRQAPSSAEVTTPQVEIQDRRAVTFDCNHPQCNKQYFTLTALYKHRKTHASIKSFRCTTCNKEFVQKSSLLRHEQTHQDEKTWMCDHDKCGKSFKLKEYLDAHKKTHISVKDLRNSNEVVTTSELLA